MQMQAETPTADDEISGMGGRRRTTAIVTCAISFSSRSRRRALWSSCTKPEPAPTEAGRLPA